MFKRIQQFARTFRKDSRLTTLLVSFVFAIPYTLIAGAFLDVSYFYMFLSSLILFYLLFGNLRLMPTPNLRMIYSLVAIFKLFLLVWITLNKPAFLSGVDWYNFHNYALAAIDGGGGVIEIYNRSFDLFVFFMASLYSVFGVYIDHIYIAVFIISLIVFKYVFKSMLAIYENNKLAATTAILMFLWPVSIIFSMSVLREVPIQLAVVVSFYNLIMYLKLGKRINLLGLIVFSIIASLMHSGMIALLAVYMYIILQGSIKKKRKLISLRALILATVLIAVLAVTSLGAGITSRFDNLGTVDDLNSQYEFQLSANTTYISSTVSSFGEYVLTAPYRFVMFAASPFPWQVRSLDTLVAFLIDGLLQVIVIVLIFKLYKRSKKFPAFTRNIVVAGTLCIVATYFVFAMGTNNYGTAMRHRAKVTPIVVVLVGMYVATSKKRDISYVKR